MKKYSAGKFVQFLNIIPLTYKDFQRNMLIINFFFFFRLEKELLGRYFSTYQGRLAESGIMDIVNENQQKFEPNAVIVDRAYENLNSEFVDNLDAHSQIKNDETGEPICSQDTEPTE